MDRSARKIIGILAVMTLAAPGASAQTMDSLWVALVNDSSLVIRPQAPPDTVQQLADSAVLPEIVSADYLLARQDSILRAERRADSLRTASEDSVAQALARMDSLIVVGQDYRDGYRYADAVSCFRRAQQICSDAALKASLDSTVQRCVYAQKHTSNVPILSVVAREMFGIDDFFLYYPLPDRSWHEVEGAPPMYYTGTEDEVFVSRDASLEMVSPMTFGDRLYFSSRSLDGFGGYDLYVCEWNSRLGEWGEPKNLGFPYSSSADDFIFAESEDGRYNIFASNRGLSDSCDSVYVYVVERESKSGTVINPTPDQLAEIAQLVPQVDLKVVGTAEKLSERTAELNSRYREILANESELMTALAESEGEEAEKIRAELQAATSEKKRVEAQILEDGKVRDRLSEEKDHKVAGVEGAYLFTRKSFGNPLKINYIEN